MQQVMRPYATAGIALVGAAMIAVTPIAAPVPDIQMRPVKLVDAWSNLIADSTANWQNILNGADSSAISQVFSLLATNPSGVIGALSNLTPTVTTDLTSLPGTISVQLPPGLELAIAELGSTATTFNAISSVLPELTSNPYEALGTVLNGYLNGTDNISLLNGTINIAGFNGILAPLQDVSVNLNLTNLVNALGLSDLNLSNLDLTSLLSQLGLGNLTLGSLFSDLGLSNDGLGTLLANGSGVTSLGGLLNLLGLDNLGSGDSITLGLTNILQGLGLDTNLDLNSLKLADVLGAFDINSPLKDLSGLSLSSILSSFGVTVPTEATLGSTTLTSLVDSLGLGGLWLGTLLSDAEPLVPAPVATVIATLLATPLVEGLLNQVNLGDLLSSLKLGNGGSLSLDTLLGDLGISLPSSMVLDNTTIAEVLASLGIKLPGDLTIGGVLGDLGFSSATGDLTLGGLLSDLGNPFGLLNITDLLNGLNLGNLLSDLNLSNLPLDLGNLDLSTLNLGDLLGDLGLGNLATVSVEPFGGLATELVDVVPQQILAALGM